MVTITVDIARFDGDRDRREMMGAEKGGRRWEGNWT